RGDLAEAEQRWSDAIGHRRSVFLALEKSYDPDHPTLAKARFALARALAGAGKTDQAKEQSRAALRRFRSLGPAFGPESVEIERFLASLSMGAEGP
ncbi:MAG TPA: tetratricopeptide repeat protein, partial [Nannocystis exedens]|nr:tetratricopeptide repeat protein [Nannocystis exedens]